jgi:hypothetical protein
MYVQKAFRWGLTNFMEDLIDAGLACLTDYQDTPNCKIALLGSK